MLFAALLCSNHRTFCSFQWLNLTIWVLGISSIFKFENWLGTLGFVTFWKFSVFDKNPKIMKFAYFKSDFFGHFQLQILTTGKPLEIDSWNQVQIIPWYLSFCREKVPGEYIYPVKRKPYGLFWQSEIWNSLHMIICLITIGLLRIGNIPYARIFWKLAFGPYFSQVFVAGKLADLLHKCCRQF